MVRVNGSTVGSGKNGTRRRAKNRDEEEKQLALLMEWVSERVDQASHVPRLSDVVEQAGRRFGFNVLSRRAISAALSPIRTQGRCSGQSGPARRARSASFSRR